ncbi:helix-turn-helix domain-containing protein [Fusicatenibacter sp.]
MQNITKNIDFFRLFDVLSEEEVYYKENPAPSALATGNSSLTWNDLLLCAEQEHGCPLHHNRSLLALRHPRYAPTPAYSHAFFEMLYVMEGECVCTFAHKKETLKSGNLCFLPPLQKHHVHPVGDAVALSIFVHHSLLTDSFLTTLHLPDTLFHFFTASSGESARRYFVFRSGAKDLLQIQMLGLYHELRRSDTFSDTMLSSMFTSLLITLVRSDELLMHSLQENDSTDKILSLFRNNYDTITLSELAAKLHYTVPYCSRYLKKNLGCTFSELLRHTRFQRAEELLTGSSMTVGQISDELGYENPESFIRIFKKEYQMTPAQYRIQSLEKKAAVLS